VKNFYAFGKGTHWLCPNTGGVKWNLWTRKHGLQMEEINATNGTLLEETPQTI
jgi:hypothetical protein